MPAYDADSFVPPAPLARVTLRDPSSRAAVSDIAMLIDCGADVTLVPKSALGQLGATIDATSGYELMGFDGTKSIAQAVHLDLVFLSRAFKGRFLLIDQQWGIIGRDILNHVALLLDGPRLIWTEHGQTGANRP